MICSNCLPAYACYNGADVCQDPRPDPIIGEVVYIATFDRVNTGLSHQVHASRSGAIEAVLESVADEVIEEVLEEYRARLLRGEGFARDEDQSHFYVDQVRILP